MQSVQLTDNRVKSSATPYQETENRKKGTGGALTSAAVLPGDTLLLLILDKVQKEEYQIKESVTHISTTQVLYQLYC